MITIIGLTLVVGGVVGAQRFSYFWQELAYAEYQTIISTTY